MAIFDYLHELFKNVTISKNIVKALIYRCSVMSWNETEIQALLTQGINRRGFLYSTIKMMAF